MSTDPASDEPHLLVLPGHALVLLVGPPGSGKSTFARRHFRATEVLSSDAFRAMVADDEADQRATPAAFDLLHRAAVHRLTRARLTVVDATNLKRADRRQLLELARGIGRPAVAIVFAHPAAVPLTWNRERPDRTVASDVVHAAAALTLGLAARPEQLLSEGFRAVHVLRGVEDLARVRIVREGRPPRRVAPAATPPRLRSTGARSSARPGRTS